MPDLYKANLSNKILTIPKGIEWILVDANHYLINFDKWELDQELYAMLDKHPARKIIVTNADAEKVATIVGLVGDD